MPPTQTNRQTNSDSRQSRTDDNPKFAALFTSSEPLANAEEERMLEITRQELFADLIISFYREWKQQ